ncbi:hypothetical protein Q7P37_008702 [Cladosporium fusiforme]
MSSFKQAVSSSKAPKVSHDTMNQAIVSRGIVYSAGQIAIDPATGKLVDGDIQAHTPLHQHQCIQNLSSVLEAAGTTLSHVLKVTIFVANIEDVPQMNEVYKQYWGEVKPARSCVGVKQLPLGTDIEIECIATLPE